MDEFDQLVKRYGGIVDRGRGLTKVAIPVQLPVRLDIGFATSYRWTWLGRLLPFLRHYELAKGAYVYGDRAVALSRIMETDDDLCSAIRLVFDRYAFDLECSDERVTARLNTISRPLSDDPTAGVNLLSSLAMITRSLGELDYRELKAASRPWLVWGPARSRTVFTASILLFIFCIPIFLPQIAKHLWPHTAIHR
ncbi:hypothetical protein PQR46_28145 [Paraburkholderia sediminicola]|uniref:hypothetical protein n=1 Tax=Paraburkholderia TaxID=1822464 RepID=UPI0038B963E7